MRRISDPANATIQLDVGREVLSTTRSAHDIWHFIPLYLRRLWIVAMLLAATSFVVVSPVLATPFSGDDSFNSYLDGWRLAHHSSILQMMLAEFQEWDVGRGRFIPVLQIVNVLQFHFSHNAFPLKLVQALCIATDVALLFALALEIGCSVCTSTGVASIAIWTLSIRNWYDAIAQYNLHLPLATALGLTALLFAHRAHRTLSRKSYAISIAAFALASMTYEIFVPIVVPIAYFFLQGVVDRRRTFAQIIPFAGILAFEAIAILAIRRAVPQIVGGAYGPAPLTSTYLPTVWRQFNGAFPLNYIVSDPQFIFRNHALWWLHVDLYGCVCATLVALAFVIAKKPGESNLLRPASRKALVVCGIALALGPALIVALSPFYQTTIHDGLPYIPVFAQGFGIALLLAPAVSSVFNFFNNGVSYFLKVIVVAAACLITYSANSLVAPSFDHWGVSRETIVQGIAHGATVDVPDRAIVFLDTNDIANTLFLGDSVWSNIWMYRLLAGKTFRTFPITAEKTLAFREAWEFRAVVDDPRNTRFIVNHIAKKIGGRRILLGSEIVDRTPNPKTSRVGFASAFADRDFQFVSARDGFRTYRFTPQCPSLPPDALVNESPSVIEVEYGDGFSVAETDGKTSFRWSGRRGVIKLLNPTDSLKHVRIRARVSTGGKHLGTLNLFGTGVRQSIPLSSASTPFAIDTSVAAESGASLRLSTDAPNEAIAGDTRDLRFRVMQLTVTDLRGCATGDQATTLPNGKFDVTINRETQAFGRATNSRAPFKVRLD